jgi:hypothetical protein
MPSLYISSHISPADLLLKPTLHIYKNQGIFTTLAFFKRVPGKSQNRRPLQKENDAMMFGKWTITFDGIHPGRITVKGEVSVMT